jgi:FkbM family methyltransferase
MATTTALKRAAWRKPIALALRMGDHTFPKPDLKTIAKQARVTLSPRGALLKATLDNGAVVYGRNRAGFGGRAVYIYGDDYEPEFKHLSEFLDASGVFIEVGANTGKHSIKAAKHYGGKGVVLAIEPNLAILAVLQRSVDANRFTNVRLRNFCIGDKKSAERLWMNQDRPVMFSLHQNDGSADSLSTLVVTLDELFAWEGLDRLDYLKVCAEGSEGEVIAGGRQTISRHRPIIQIEDASVDITIDEPDYACFKAPRGSISKVWIPTEHAKLQRAVDLGWDRLR